MIPTVAQWADVALIKRAITSQPELAWILPSYICALVSIESGWDPTVVSGSSAGLMQVEPATASEVVSAYKLSGLGSQTDPYTSLLVGTCYFDLCARKILAARGTKSLGLVEVAEAYNAGYSGFLAGNGDPRYGAKMLAQQLVWAPLVDSVPAPVAPPPAPLPPPATISDAVIDISHYETGSIDFATVAAGGIVGVVLKATQGTGFVDPTFLPRAADARAAGLEVGAYHFMDGADAAQQAIHFLNVANAMAGVTWLAVDWEAYPPSQATQLQAEMVAATIEGAIGNVPIIYMDRFMLPAPSEVLSRCPLWLAEFGSDPIYPPGFSAWKLWQHTDGQVGSAVVPVPGIGRCDRSIFAGTVGELKAWWANPI